MLKVVGNERDEEGHALVVRNGKGRPRKITLGAGTIPGERVARERPANRSRRRAAPLDEPHPASVRGSRWIGESFSGRSAAAVHGDSDGTQSATSFVLSSRSAPS